MSLLTYIYPATKSSQIEGEKKNLIFSKYFPKINRKRQNISFSIQTILSPPFTPIHQVQDNNTILNCISSC